jgi:glycogen synthase
MKIIDTISELENQLQGYRHKGETIGLVPTMGALHQGHASLVERCVADNKISIVSLFVNPTQFNNKEDLKHYPRTPEKDHELLERLGVDYVFSPSVEEMYPEEDKRVFDFGQLDKVMETIKKLRWVPDIIHCHGWFSGLAPLYVKKGYKDDPCFKDTKIVYSIYDETFKKPFSKEVAHKLRFEGIGDAEIEKIKSRGVMDYQNLIKLAVDYSDGVVLGSKDIDPEITKYLETEKVDFLPYQPDFEKSVDEIEAFYNKIAD